MPPQAVVIGNIIKETIVKDGEVVGPVLGSPAAYSSLAMAAAGCPTGLVSHYGNDLPDQISELAIVDTSGFIPSEHSTTNTLIYSAQGTKTVSFERTAPDLSGDDIPAGWWDAKVYHVCPMNYEVSLDLVEELDRKGATIVVDLGGYGGATSLVRHAVGTAVGNEVIGRLASTKSFLKASEEDLASVFPGSSIEEAVGMLVAMGAALVIVTLGPDGAMYRLGQSRPVYVSGYPARSRMKNGSLNPTGAGDSFDGGVVAGLCLGWGIEESIKYGNALASVAVESAGGCVRSRMPSHRMIMERMGATAPKP